MRFIGLFFVALLLIAGCRDKYVPEVNSDLKGKVFDGFVIGGCYMLDSDDPFETKHVLMKVVDYKNHYIKYNYYYKNGDWHTSRSASTRWKGIWKPSNCPPEDTDQ